MDISRDNFSVAQFQLTDVERYTAVRNTLHLKALVMIIGCIFSVCDVEPLLANAMTVDVHIKEFAMFVADGQVKGMC